MKRSEINRLIGDAVGFFESMKFALPPWGYWSPDTWKQKADLCGLLMENQLGWDLTDFGSGDFHREGLRRISSPAEGLADHVIEVETDGITRHLPAGDTVRLSPGESITLPARLYHEFWGESGGGKVLVGEVSAVNDDKADNRFLEKVGRFPEIKEDAEPAYLLVGDYKSYL